MKIVFEAFCFILSFQALSCEKRLCNDDLGECVPHFKCLNLTDFDDGRHKINVRFSVEPEEENCHYLETCCDSENVIADDRFHINNPGSNNPYDVEVLHETDNDEFQQLVRQNNIGGNSYKGHYRQHHGQHSRGDQSHQWTHGTSWFSAKNRETSGHAFNSDFDALNSRNREETSGNVHHTSSSDNLDSYSQWKDSNGNSHGTVTTFSSADYSEEEETTPSVVENSEDDTNNTSNLNAENQVLNEQNQQNSNRKFSSGLNSVDEESRNHDQTQSLHGYGFESERYSEINRGFKVVSEFEFNANSRDKLSSSQDSCDESTHECIPFFYCSNFETTDGAGIFSSRSGSVGFCGIKSQVCCNKEDNIARMKPTTCGYRNKNGIGYQITNSVDESQYAEFPWMAALIERVNCEEPEKYICGGSLIHPSVVLTAAHCVNERNADKLRVRLGEWDTQSNNELLPHKDFEVSQIIIHSDFGPANLFNDVALLILKKPTQLSVHINTICLPPQNYKAKGNCIATGWGADKFNSQSYRSNLKKLDLPVVPLRTCQDNLRTTKLGSRFRIHQSFMCAGGEKDVDTCTGDGGSPLVCPVPDKEDIYYQAGIVAWGIDCGQENIPGVYANVAKFRNWIDGKMIEMGYGTNSYSVEE